MLFQIIQVDSTLSSQFLTNLFFTIPATFLVNRKLFDSISLTLFCGVGCINYEYSITLLSSIFNQGDVCFLWMYSLKYCFPNPCILCSSAAVNLRVNVETIRAVLGLPVPFDESRVLLAICSHSASSTIVSHATLYTTSLSIPLNLPKLQYLQSVGRSHLAKFHSNERSVQTNPFISIFICVLSFLEPFCSNLFIFL